MPLVERHHLLLVTLLMGNALAMEALPIFLDRLVPSWAAVLLSVTAVLIFGEYVECVVVMTAAGQFGADFSFNILVCTLRRAQLFPFSQNSRLSLSLS